MFEVSSMKVSRISLLAILLLLAIPAVMHAQSGCSDSPEAPTDVLLMIGSVGMIYGSSLAMKFVGKHRK
jgi:XrtJ-associated TM-motif-TM protein